MFVVDASVAVKWLVPEERRREAMEFMTGAGTFLAPDIIVTEVSSALSRKARLRQISPAIAEEALSAWMSAIRRGVFVLGQSVDLVEESFRLSLALDHPLPDCFYLAFALRVGGVLVTADEKLARKAGEIQGVEVRLLGKV